MPVVSAASSLLREYQEYINELTLKLKALRTDLKLVRSL